MKFKQTEFREALIKNNQTLDNYLLLSLKYSLDTTIAETKLWLQQLFAEIYKILTDTSSIPILKVSCIKFVLNLFLIGDVLILQNIQRRIYPIIKINSLIDKQLPLQHRGENLFTQHPQYIYSNELGKQMTRILGVQFVRFCLQTVPVWAKWMPADLQNDTYPSVYFKGYEQLLEMELQFPNQNHFIFYSSQNIQIIENRIKNVIERLESNTSLLFKNYSRLSYKKMSRNPSLLQSLSQLEKHHKVSLNSEQVFDKQIQYHGREASFTPNEMVTMAQKQTQKTFPTLTPGSLTDPISSAIVQNLLLPSPSQISNDIFSSGMRQERRIYVQQQQVQITKNIQSQNNRKSIVPILQPPSIELQKVYQTKIHEISKNYRLELEQTVSSLRAKYSSQIQHYRSVYEQLKHQNLQLKAQLSQKSVKLQEYVSMIHSLSEEKAKITQHFQQMISSTRIQSSQNITLEQIRRLKQQNYELKKNLLDDCLEEQEFYVEELKQQKDRFVAFDTIQKILSAASSKLCADDRIRFKKCLLKSKGILYKNKHLQVGCITCFKQLNIIKIKLCITNISNQQVHGFNLQFNHSDDIQFMEKQNAARTLPCQYQQQLTYICKIKHKDFVLPEFRISYIVGTNSYGFCLLLPASKSKLIQTMSNPHFNWYKQQMLQRVILINHQILPQIKKLKEIYPNIYQGKQSYILPFLYLNEQFEMQFRRIGETNMKLQISYESGNQDNAYELLDQFSFILGCE